MLYSWFFMQLINVASIIIKKENYVMMIIIILFRNVIVKWRSKTSLRSHRRKRKFHFLEPRQECERWVECDPCLYFWSPAQCRKTEQTLNISGETDAHSLGETLTSEGNTFSSPSGCRGFSRFIFLLCPYSCILEKGAGMEPPIILLYFVSIRKHQSSHLYLYLV